MNTQRFGYPVTAGCVHAPAAAAAPERAAPLAISRLLGDQAVHARPCAAMCRHAPPCAAMQRDATLLAPPPPARSLLPAGVSSHCCVASNCLLPRSCLPPLPVPVASTAERSAPRCELRLLVTGTPGAHLKQVGPTACMLTLFLLYVHAHTYICQRPCTPADHPCARRLSSPRAPGCAFRRPVSNRIGLNTLAGPPRAPAGSRARRPASRSSPGRGQPLNQERVGRVGLLGTRRAQRVRTERARGVLCRDDADVAPYIIKPISTSGTARGHSLASWSLGIPRKRVR